MSTWKNIVLIICMQYGFDVRSSMHEGTQEIDMERDTPTTALMSHPGHALEVSEDTLMAELLPESTDSDDFLFFFCVPSCQPFCPFSHPPHCHYPRPLIGKSLPTPCPHFLRPPSLSQTRKSLRACKAGKKTHRLNTIRVILFYIYIYIE